MTNVELLNPSMTSVFQSMAYAHGIELRVNKVTYMVQIISLKLLIYQTSI